MADLSSNFSSKSIEDFIPDYPDIDAENFGYEVTRKKEFYEYRLESSEASGRVQGELLDNQKFMQRFFSPNTPYKKGLICDRMGTGKSTVGSAIVENSKNSEYNGKPRKPALIFVPNEDLIKNYVNEIANVATKDVYLAKFTAKELKDGALLTDKAKMGRIHASIRKSYKIVTYGSILKKLEPDDVLRRKYNGCNIFVDEAHYLQIQPKKKKKTKGRNKEAEGDEDEIDAIAGTPPTGGLSKKEPALVPEEDVSMLYNNLHHFLHVVEDCTILLFTGTPIWDNVSEIAKTINLILEDKKYGGRDEQLPTGNKFKREFFENGILTEPGAEILRDRFRGKISFLREMITSAKREEKGTKAPWMKYVTVFPCQMSEFQAAHARIAKDTEVAVKVKKGAPDRMVKGGTVRRNARNAMNMILPIFDKKGEVVDGGYSAELFKKYTTKTTETIAVKSQKKVIITSYGITDPFLRKELKNNLQEYSIKLAFIIQYAKEHPKEVIFIYNESVTGPGGAIFDGLCLELHGFEWARSAAGISRPGKKKRFAVITADEQTTKDSKQIEDLLASHNKPDNCYGDRLQIIIGSQKMALGHTIKHVRATVIKMPSWNIPSIDQAQARGFRFGSHDALKPEERYVNIFKLVAVEAPKRNGKEEAKGKGFPVNASFSNYKTTDVEVYEIAEDKEFENTQVYRLLKEAAFNCALYYKRNVLESDVDGTRDCDYTKCNYICDGFPENKIKKGKRDGKGLEKEPPYDYSIPPEKLDYSTYNLLYSGPSVKKMRDELIKLFNNYFSLKFEMVKKLLEIKPDQEINLLKAIDDVIEARVLIRNRYGFGCYLKEQGDMLFLDDSISPKANYPEVSYIENPLVTEKTSMSAFVEILELENDKANVIKFCKATPAQENEIYEKLSHHTKIILLEASYALSESKKTDATLGNRIIKFVLENNKDNLHKMSDGSVVHVLRTEEYKGIAYDVAAKDIKVTGLMRVYDKENKMWTYVENAEREEKYVKELKGKKDLTVKRRDEGGDSNEESGARGEEEKENPYGMKGWISKKDKILRIQVIRKGKFTRGKDCNSFGILDFLDLFINTMKHMPNPGPEFKKLKKADLIAKIKGRIGFDEYKNKLESKDEKYLASLLMMILWQKEDFCAELRKWLESNDLLTIK